MLSLKIGGVVNLLLAVFHLLFWKALDWPESLLCLTADQSSIMQVLSIHLAMAIALFGYLSLFHSKELTTTKLGKSLLLFIGVFYLVRALNQAIFWDMMEVSSILLLFGCLILGAVYVFNWKSVT